MMMSDRSNTIVRKSLDLVNISKDKVIDEDPVEIQYHLLRDSHGNCEYVEYDEINVRDYIASFVNGCSLKAILDRCALMPARDKIAYVNQRTDGLGADLTSIPKDGTEAQIMIRKVKEFIPDYAQRIKNGESFESLIAELLPKSGNATNNTAAPANNAAVNSVNKEDILNG